MNEDEPRATLIVPPTKFKLKKSDIMQIVAAVLFLIGAVFMLMFTFAEDTEWAFWVGLGITAIATIIFVLQIIENKKNKLQRIESKAKTE